MPEQEFDIDLLFRMIGEREVLIRRLQLQGMGMAQHLEGCKNRVMELEAELSQIKELMDKMMGKDCSHE
jgi:hypothetical protein